MQKTVDTRQQTVLWVVDVVAERPLVPQTRIDAGNRIGVEWRGRCWAFLAGDEPPVLMEVMATDGAVARWLTPGHVRSVQAFLRWVATRSGWVLGLEVLNDGAREAPTKLQAAARGLSEGRQVQIAADTLRRDLRGRTGTLVRFTAATVEVDGKGYTFGLNDLAPLDGAERAGASSGEFP